jgi:ABC-type dipeptide/oligopeptide/nickel transport system permease subunit
MKPAPDLPVYDQDVITYTSDNRIERFVTVVVLLAGLIMLIAPLWILNAVQGTQQKLGVITMFIVVFLGMVSWATGARIFESLAATAA